ncbi:MAG: heat-inducible transcriptional repressor HrcA [Azospirillaceae bacterium]
MDQRTQLFMSYRESLSALNERSREIFRHVVEAYVETGEPIGSRTLSRKLGMSLSPATIRNVMADLEDMGLLAAPHTSAGRLPTEAGMRLFVHGLLEVGDLSEEDRNNLEAQAGSAGRSLPDVLNEATRALSGLSSCAGLVFAPKIDRPLRHIEFVSLGPGRALVVLVTEDGIVENRVLDVPIDLPPSALVMASNFLSAHLVGRTLAEARSDILREIEAQKAALDALTAKVVEAGIALPSSETDAFGAGTLIIRGQSKLLNDIAAVEDLESIRALFDALETRETMVRLLEATQGADGVQIFIGRESDLFSHSGCSVIIAPYKDTRDQIVGAIGVVGPTRLNYARIIPMVDYTAKVVGRLLWSKSDEAA